jgi:hypothetical protein
MFFSLMKMYVPSVSYGVGMRIFWQPSYRNYYCEKQNAMNILLAQEKNKLQQKHGNKTFPHPFCMDCIHFVPVEHSSLFPNSGCSLFKPLKPCLNTRSDKELCGVEGKYFQKR